MFSYETFILIFRWLFDEMWSTAGLLQTLSLSTIVAGGASQEPSAQLKNGTYVGRYSAEYNQDFFLGIPYAQPPIGDLRFQQAQSLNKTWEGTRETFTYSSLCVGYGVLLPTYL